MATEQSYSAADTPANSPQAAEAESHWPLAEDGFWHGSAPGGVWRHYSSGDAAGGWKRWRRHLLGRSNALHERQLAEKLAGSRKRASGALRWGTIALPAEESRFDWLLKLADARPRRARELATEAPEHIERWLAETADPSLTLRASVPVGGWSPNVRQAIEAVAWARAPPALTRVCSGEIWWQLLERLHHLATIARVPLDGESADPLAHQLACGELPWSLAALFAEIEPCRQLAPAAAKALSAGIAELLDGTGVPHARYLAIFHALVGSWTRCRLLAAAVASRSAKSALDHCWDDDAEQEFFPAVREALRLTRSDGTPVLSAQGESAAAGHGNAGSWLTEIAAGLAASDKGLRRTVAAISAGRRTKQKHGRSAKPPIKNLPDAAFHSEWAALAMLQTDWSAAAARLAVAYSGKNVRIELEADRRVLLSGDWGLEVRADGELIEPRDSWSEVCWLSDADCDYLELEIELGRSRRVQRHMLLSRKDQFLLLADAILGDEPCELNYRGRLPLAADIAVRPATETRELTLVAKKPRAILLPLELPEWQADPRGGSLTCTQANRTNSGSVNGYIDGNPVQANGLPTNGLASPHAVSHSSPAGATPSNGTAASGTKANRSIDPEQAAPMEITLNQSIHGRRLFAPLWIDLSGRRVRRHDRDPLTWRQLTVGEQRQIVPRDVAVAYRVQCGEQQWVVYRSLAPPGNRTFLGVNLSTDFFVGRFASDGETDSIVEIE